MTNEKMIEVITWMKRYKVASKQLESDKNLLSLRENVVNKCTSKYENDGSGQRDVESLKKRHEDALMEYSTQKAKVEKDEAILIKIFDEISNVIRQVSDPIQRNIAIDIYFKDMKWEAIQEEEHISRATLQRYRIKMLVQVADILKL